MQVEPDLHEAGREIAVAEGQQHGRIQPVLYTAGRRCNISFKLRNVPPGKHGCGLRAQLVIKSQ